MDHSPPCPQPLAHISEDGQRTQSVRDHLLGTAALAETFARPFGGQEQAYLAGLLHDVGKYSAAFQQRLRGGPKVDHATAGAKIAYGARQPEVAFAIAGHHGGLPDGGARTDPDGTGTLFARLKKEVPPCEGWKDEIPLPAAHRPPLPGDGFAASFYTRMLYSCLVDADYLDTETFMNGAPAPRGGGAAPDELLQRLQTYIAPWWDAKNALNRKRCDILRACLDAGESAAPGLFALTVPTGGGKTVSSLAFALAHAAAQGKTRVIYVIPYTSIIDQTAEVFRGILGEENVIEHHSGADFSMPEGEFDPRLYRKALAAENWDAPVIVTTAVQFFESLFANRASRCRKLHNIAGSVVVFDEAQTLPVPYLRPCVAAIGQLVQFYGVTAVLCTATQPALQPLFDELAPGLVMREICPDADELYRFFRRTTLRQAGELTAEEVTAQLCDVPQALCVVNRRATVQHMGGGPHDLEAVEGVGLDAGEARPRRRQVFRLDGQGHILGFHIAVAAPLILEAEYPGRVLPDRVQVVPLGTDAEQVLLRPMLHIPAAERHLHPNGGVVAIVEIAEMFKNIPLVLRRGQTVLLPSPGSPCSSVTLPKGI